VTDGGVPREAPVRPGSPDPVGSAHPGSWVLGAAVVLLSRLPFLGPGYGLDPDAYRVVETGRRLAETGDWVPSRPPGFPLHEAAVALVQTGTHQPWVTNLVSAVAAVGLFLAFGALLRRLRVRAWWPLALALTFVPSVFAASTVTMDYLPGLALGVAAAWAVVAGRVPLAAGALALAIATRITWGALLPALLWWRGWGAEEEGRRGVEMAWLAGGAAVGLGAYLPAYLRDGAALLAFAENPAYPPLATLAVRAGPDLWGTLGVLAVTAAAVGTVVARRRGPAESALLGRVPIFCGLAAVPFVVLFLRLPQESDYLLPSIPFALLALGVALPPRGAGALSLCLLLAPFVGVGRGGVGMGPLLEYQAARSEAAGEVRLWARTIRDLPPGSVVVTGFRGPELRVAGVGGPLVDPGSEDGVTLVAYLPDLAACRALVAAGRSVRFLPRGLDDPRVPGPAELEACGARPLRVEPPSAERPSGN